MLILTEGATQAIHQLTGDQPGAGLRIFRRSPDAEDVKLGTSISEGPEPTDEVVEQAGCYVFLDRAVVPLIDGHTLDAQGWEGPQGVQFRFVA